MYNIDLSKFSKFSSELLVNLLRWLWLFAKQTKKLKKKIFILKSRKTEPYFILRKIYLKENNFRKTKALQVKVRI